MNKPIVIIGFGGHARVLLSAFAATGQRVIGATCLEATASRNKSNEIKLFLDQELLETYSPPEVFLCLGLGSTQADSVVGRRQEIVQRFEGRGYEFVGVRHPTAWICPSAQVSISTQIHAGAVVQAGAIIEDFSIVNTHASVDHDCRVGKFCHLAPGVTLSGSVKLEDYVHVGTGASVIQDVSIGTEAMVAAGATVVRDVAAGARVCGTPARNMK